MFNNNKRKKFFIFIPFIIAAVVLLFGWIVMLLWNAILPSAIHAGELTYWQAVGLLILSRILFVGFGGKRFGGGGFKERMYWKEKWSKMSDEEKAKFKEQWRMRCGRSKNDEVNSES
jgi:energy-coupling factor transporter transmembrane protein EcfT